MDTRLLLLADSRLPAGGHAHSGGLEPAAAAGTVASVADLADFLRGRLATTGLVTAALAAAACAHGGEGGGGDLRDGWARLDAEVDARTPSPAQRKASRAQGRALLRAARTTWPHPALESLAALSSRDLAVVRGEGHEPLQDHGERRGGPHHPVALGAATGAAGGTSGEAAVIAAYGSVTGPASAAVRLLGLDPLAVHRALADLAPEVDSVAARAAAQAATGQGGWAALPALSAPCLDLFAEVHLETELRLFES
jgi:urease accessory protein